MNLGAGSTNVQLLHEAGPQDHRRYAAGGSAERHHDLAVVDHLPASTRAWVPVSTIGLL